MPADSATAVPESRSKALARPPGRGSRAASLDLHEESSGEAPPKTCKRWPKRLSLISNHGEIVKGRCSSPNLCEYCARLAAVVNAELLALDAMHGVSPTSYLVLTTPSTVPDPRAYYESKAQLQRKLRQEVDGFQAAWLVEFTTGRADQSGGHRRPHLNGLLKAVTTSEDATVVRQVVEDVWCRREAASPAAQYVAPVQEMAGLMRYLALHFLKERQAPPLGWRGHRFTTTRGYLWLPTPQARKVAREALTDKRELWRALATGADAAEAEDRVEWARFVRSQTTWSVGNTPNLGRQVQDAAGTRV
jgi:hypothetical protein